MPEEFLFSDLLKTVEQTTGFTALPQGEYDVEISQATAGKTGTQKSKISLRYRVLSGPHQGRNVFNDHVLSPSNPNAMVIFFRHMAAYGLGHDYFAANPSLERVAQDLNGKKIRVRLGVRLWDGAERNSVLAIMPLGAGTSSSGLPPMPSPVSQAPERPAPPLPQAAPLPPPPAPPMPAATVPVPAVNPLPEPAAMTKQEENGAAEPEPEEIKPPAMPKPPPGLPF